MTLASLPRRTVQINSVFEELGIAYSSPRSSKNKTVRQDRFPCTLIRVLLKIGEGQIGDGKLLTERSDEVPKVQLDPIESGLLQASVPMSF